MFRKSKNRQKMKILAVSGGIDSMVMLDFLMKKPDFNQSNTVVAHFNHGVRECSGEDENFVRKAAKRYGLKFFSKTEKLGKNCAEATARKARYDFLFELAEKLDGEIYTAQHIDDLMESIMINVRRKTGWRGIAVMNREKIIRPFLQNQEIDKVFIYHYAAENQVKWRVDSTNNETVYLRNGIRQVLQNLEKKTLKTLKNELWRLNMLQKTLAREIEQILKESVMAKNGKNEVKLYPRQPFLEMDESVAYEYLRFLANKEQFSLSGADIQKLLEAIKYYCPGKKVNLSKNQMVLISLKYFQFVR